MSSNIYGFYGFFCIGSITLDIEPHNIEESQYIEILRICLVI